MIPCKYYKKNHHRQKYLSCHSTLGRYIHHICRIEPNLYISPSVLSRGSCKFCRWYHHLLLHRCSHQSVIRSNCYIVAMDLAAASTEVFLHQQLYLLVSSFLFIFPTLSALLCCNKFRSVSFIGTLALS